MYTFGNLRTRMGFSAKKTPLSAKRSPAAKKKPTKATGHDPVKKKTGATATTHGSTYDYRKKDTEKSPAKKKSASVTVGTAGSSKSTTTSLDKKKTVAAKPKAHTTYKTKAPATKKTEKMGSKIKTAYHKMSALDRFRNRFKR